MSVFYKSHFRERRINGCHKNQVIHINGVIEFAEIFKCYDFARVYEPVFPFVGCIIATARQEFLFEQHINRAVNRSEGLCRMPQRIIIVVGYADCLSVRNLQNPVAGVSCSLNDIEIRGHPQRS